MTSKTTMDDSAGAQALLELAATLTAAADECVVVAGVIDSLSEASLASLEKRLSILGDACHNARRQIRKPGREYT
jgi:hypothetical protein